MEIEEWAETGGRRLKAFPPPKMRKFCKKF